MTNYLDCLFNVLLWLRWNCSQTQKISINLPWHLFPMPSLLINHAICIQIPFFCFSDSSKDSKSVSMHRRHYIYFIINFTSRSFFPAHFIDFFIIVIIPYLLPPILNTAMYSASKCLSITGNPLRNQLLLWLPTYFAITIKINGF